MQQYVNEKNIFPPKQVLPTLVLLEQDLKEKIAFNKIFLCPMHMCVCVLYISYCVRHTCYNALSYNLQLKLCNNNTASAAENYPVLFKAMLPMQVSKNEECVIV